MSYRKHRNLIYQSGIIFLLANTLGIAYCEPSKASDCNSSIEELRYYINSEGGLVGQVKIEEDSNSPYENAKSRVYLGLEGLPMPRMGGTATLAQDIKNKAFLNSPQSIRPYAIKIIKSCSNIFSLSVHGHEVGINYSLHPDGSIRLDKCAPRGMNMPYPFGYTYCG